MTSSSRVGVIDSSPHSSAAVAAGKSGQVCEDPSISPQNSTVVEDRYPLELMKQWAMSELHWVVRGGDIQAVTALLTSGEGDPNSQSCKGMTALHFAGSTGNAEMVKLLLDFKAEVTLNAYGDTVWTIAAMYDYSDIITIFLSTTEGSAFAPLHTAARCCHVELTKRLWKAACAATEQSRQLGVIWEAVLASFLMSAVCGGNVEIITFSIVEAGAKPNLEHLLGACECGHVAATRILIDAGVSIDASALEEAYKGRHLAVVALLLAGGARGSNAPISRDTVLTYLKNSIDKSLYDFISVFLKHEKDTHQGEVSSLTWGWLMASNKPQVYMSSVLESLTMAAHDSSEGRNGGRLTFLPAQGLYVTCNVDAHKRFHPRSSFGFNDYLSSDYLPSHASLRIQLEQYLHVADKAITVMSKSRVTYLPGILAGFCFLCAALVFAGIPYAFDQILKSITRTTEACVYKMTRKDALEANFLQSLVIASDTMGAPEPLFADNTVEALIELHWGLYGQSMHTRALRFFAAQLFLFTLLIAIFRDLCAMGGGRHVLGWVLQGILFTMIVYSMWQERVIAKVTKSYSHLRNPWAAMSLVASLLVVSGQLVNIILGVPNLGVDVVNAFSAVLMWFSLLYYLLPYRSTGPLVRMILMIISDIKAFLMILFIVIIGFAAAFYSIVGYANAHTASYSTPGLALRTSFSTLFGGYDLQEMDDNPAPVVLTLLWVMFMVIVSIVLLNILIAIISDSFERLIEGSKAAWLLGKAKTTMKMHALLSDNSKKELEEYMKHADVLYVLMPKAVGSGSNSADWNGRVRAIVNRVKENSSGEFSDVRTEVCNIGCEVKDIKSDVRDLVEAFRHQHSNISDRCSETSTQVCNVGSEVEDPVDVCKTSETSDIRSDIKGMRSVVDGLVDTCNRQNSEVASMKATLQQILEALNRPSTVQSDST